MKYVVNWIPLRIRARSRNTDPTLILNPIFRGQITAAVPRTISRVFHTEAMQMRVCLVEESVQDLFWLLPVEYEK